MKKINKKDAVKITLFLQVGLGIFTVMSSMLTFIMPELGDITSRLLGITLLISAINNQLIYKKEVITVLLAMTGVVVLVLGFL